MSDLIFIKKLNSRLSGIWMSKQSQQKQSWSSHALRITSPPSSPFPTSIRMGMTTPVFVVQQD